MDMRPIDIADKMAARAVGVGQKRAIGHRRPEVRAANPDIDHIGITPALPANRALANGAGEIHHAGIGGANGGHHRLPIHHHRRIEIAQGGVQDRAILGLIDLFAGKHRLAPGRHVRSTRKRQKL